MKKVPACLPLLQGLLSGVEFFTRGNYTVQKRARQGGQRKEGNGWSCPSQDLLHNFEVLVCTLFSQTFPKICCFARLFSEKKEETTGTLETL